MKTKSANTPYRAPALLHNNAQTASGAASADNASPVKLAQTRFLENPSITMSHSLILPSTAFRVAALALAVTSGMYTSTAHAQNARATPATTSSAVSATSIIRGSSVAHTVQQNDTLSSICKHYGVAAQKCEQIAFFNRRQDNSLPAAGSTLYIPLDLLPARVEQAKIVQTTGQITVNNAPVNAGTRLDENARIVAASNSSAVVEMTDGARVTVLPSSVADIVRSRTYSAPESSTSTKVVQWLGSKIRLVQGAIESAVQKSGTPRVHKPLEVETATSIIGVRGTRFRIATADASFPYDRAEVLDGVVSNINTWKHSEITLSAGYGAVVDPNQADMQAVSLLPAPQVPEAGTVLRRPHAYWKFSTVPGAVAYRVIVSGDAGFNTIVHSQKTTKPEVDLSELPSNGIWYLRARAIDAQGLEGKDAESTIDLRQPAWLLRTPSVQSHRGRPLLMWSTVAKANFDPLPGTTTVKVEIADDSSFSAPLASVQTTGNEITLPYMAAGKYYLRVGVDNSSINNDEQQVFILDWPGPTYNKSYNLLLESIS